MSLKLIFLIICVSTLEAKQVIRQSALFFRSDYIYDDNSQAFYKAHEEAKIWTEAGFVCAAEGALLAAPSTEDEMTTLLNHMNGIPDAFLGIHDIFEEGTFITPNGTPISEIFSNWEVNEPNDADGDEDCVIITSEGLYSDVRCDVPRSFICKKDLKDLTSNPICETYDTEYFYSAKMNRCYKVHKTAMNWFTAYKVCAAEQSHLGIINSADEATVYVDALKLHPVESMKSASHDDVIFIGVNDLLIPGFWKTIFGQYLTEAGYNEWNQYQPDGPKGECGTISRDGKMNDNNCLENLLFICEKPLNSIVSLPNLVYMRSNTQ